ncbi:hypothetical protein [Calothrix sp. PCC 6303]|uniref:hypothetical protein n=1 Tax=Calothrix sp. PCC 6303 TaxID=1170562 RepID=UPI0002A039F0|nr:hypothetical protein [Calothrix sp. PCC 6303]AFZ00403.1 hypothetical protein Cal6303_1345 [Calothrix sp. PCC 6303]
MAIQQEIETTLLLPEKESEDREWQGDLIDTPLIWVLRHRFFWNYCTAVFFGSRGNLLVLLLTN